MTRLTQWLDTNSGHHNQGHLLGLAVFTLGNVDKTLEPRLAASDRRQLVPGPGIPGMSHRAMGPVVTTARDITIKTSRILRMSAVLNGIRNPNCPDYNAHTGLSDRSCVNLIKYRSPSISCGPLKHWTQTQNLGTDRGSSLIADCHDAGVWRVWPVPHDQGQAWSQP